MHARAVVILAVVLGCAGGLNAADLILNEYNAVGNNSWLDCDGPHCPTCGGPPCKEDLFCFGRIEGNGGNWFELVVTRNHLDIRGWQLEWTEDPADPRDPADAGKLTLTDDLLWTDLRGGTIITFIELDRVAGGWDTDTSYDPDAGDWWINIATLDYEGMPQTQYVTTTTNVVGDGPGNFSVGRRNWQLTIRDADSNVVFGPCGEGAPGEAADVSNEEVFKLEEDPGPDIHPVDSAYRDGTSSTFGHPNIWSGGDNQQDFGLLRCSDGLFCNGAEMSDGSGGCQPGAEPCVDQAHCDEDADRCLECTEAADCDDGLFCNGAEQCLDGTCTDGTDPCPGQSCDEDGDACVVPVACSSDPECDDGTFCNGAETCVAGQCQPGADPCPGQGCNETDQECLPPGACSSDLDCDDGVFCNGAETCTAGSCGPGTVPCTDPAFPFCDETGDDCDECARDSHCDDLDGSTRDACVEGTCVNTQVVDSDEDGVEDEDDACPNTDAGQEVDAAGCACEQLDDDGDGVNNCDDLCPDTAVNAEVDASGCAIIPSDDQPGGAELPEDDDPGDAESDEPDTDTNAPSDDAGAGSGGGSASRGGGGGCGAMGPALLVPLVALLALRFLRRTDGRPGV